MRLLVVVVGYNLFIGHSLPVRAVNDSPYVPIAISITIHNRCRAVGVSMGMFRGSDARETLHLARSMISWDAHFQRVPRVAQVLGCEHGYLFANEKGGLCRGQQNIIGSWLCETHRESVTADVVGADRQISYLQILDAVYVEALVKNAVLHDAVAFPRGHGTGSQGVPGSLDMALYPLKARCQHMS